MRLLVNFISLILLGNISVAQTDFESGLKNYDNDDYNTALFFFSKSVSANDSLPESLKMRGATLIQLDKFHEAIDDLEKSILEDSTDDKTYTYLARAFWYSKEYKSAILYYNKAIELNSRNEDNFEERAICKYNINDFVGVINDITIAIEINPLQEDFYGLRASAKGSLEQYDEAIKDLDTSLTLQSVNPKAYWGKGEMLSKLEKYKEAIDCYTQSLFFDSENQVVLYLRAVAYYELGNLPPACVDLKKSSDLGYVRAITLRNEICLNDEE